MKFLNEFSKNQGLIYKKTVRRRKEISYKQIGKLRRSKTLAEHRNDENLNIK